MLACVTGAPSAIAVVELAARLAGALQADWSAVYVSEPSPGGSTDRDASALPHLQAAERLGATTGTIAGDAVPDAIVAHARARGFTHVVIGGAGGATLARQLVGAAGDLAIHVVPGASPEPGPAGATWARIERAARAISGVNLLIVGGTVLGTTALAWTVGDRLSEVDLVMLYLLGVTVSSIWLHRFAAFVSPLLAVAAFNFFFVAPTWTFAFEHPRYLVTFAVMAIAGVAISDTSARLRDRARVERDRARRTNELLDVTRRLAASATLPEIGRAAVGAVTELTGRRAALVVGVDGDGERTAFGDAALATDDRAEVLPVEAGGRRLGTIHLAPGPGAEHPADRQLLHAALALVAGALDRAVLDAAAHQARLAAEVEQIRNALLSSVSHDLRTPLATIKGAATALLSAPVEAPLRDGLLRDIDIEADRLSRMLANILDMTRIRDGRFAPSGDWHAPEDVLGSALRAASRALGDREVRTRVPDEVTLVWMDPLLVEQALVNLLENAARHGGVGPIEVAVTLEGDGVTFEVRDHGRGFGPGDPMRWFERYQRSGPSAGSGLGLSIAHAVVTLHGGGIEASDHPEGGAVVRFSLPAGGPEHRVGPAWDEVEEVAWSS